MDEKTTEMLEWVIIAALACVSSLFLIDILNTKKTEINGAHAVVRFETVSANFDGNSGNENEQIAKVEFIVVNCGECFVFCLFQVTGGSSGIGKALAIKLAKCGANVTIIARNMVRFMYFSSSIITCVHVVNPC